MSESPAVRLEVEIKKEIINFFFWQSEREKKATDGGEIWKTLRRNFHGRM